MAKIIINGTTAKAELNLKELLLYKDLFLVLAYRDLKIRYAQTLLGPAWVLFQPLVTIVIFTLVFEQAIEVDTKGVPYPLFTFAGMCGWNYFSSVLNQSGTSITGAQNMINKIYFPRLIIPLSKAVVGLVDFGIILLMFFILMIVYRIELSFNFLLLPAVILITIIAALAFGIWLSALTVRYRDFQVVIPFLVQLGLYATPVAYPVTMVPEKYRLLFYFNPMTGIVEAFRWVLLGGANIDNYCMISFATAFVLFFTGLFYFKKTERIMADIL